MDTKVVTVVVPTYNEEKNIPLVYQRIAELFHNKLEDVYQWELMFIDNCSTDCSRKLIEDLAFRDSRVKAIFNARNFGFDRSVFYGLSQAEGDCAVLMYADMQDPPEVITQFLEQWEAGYKIVTGVKTASRENPVMYFLRGCYYRLIKAVSETEHISQFDGFGLYDRSFIKVLRDLDDTLPYLRGIVAELGFQRTVVSYTQEVRKYGKSKQRNFFALYDGAMLGLTSYSKVIMRLATLLGFGLSAVCAIVAAYIFCYKIFHWDAYPVGNAAISVGVFFLGAVQLFFIGLLGEYILNINTRVLHHPLVVEERRINFGNAEAEERAVVCGIKTSAKELPL